MFRYYFKYDFWRFKTLAVVLGVLFLLLFILLAGFCVYLDAVVRDKFEGKRFSLPAKVYARPLELFSGKQLSTHALRWELKLLGYRQVVQVKDAGQYSAGQDQFLVYSKAFTYWDGPQSAQLWLLEFEGDTLRNIKNMRSGKSEDLVRLEPLLIGGIYPDKNEDRELVRYQQLPQYFLDALIAVEDQRFYSHHGVDFRAIGRAFVATVSGAGIQGGSTLTQQLVKNFFLTPDRKLWRKFKEVLMAVLLELHYEKQEILETYVNEVYFGQDRNRAIHGVALASQFYFGNSVEHISLHQAALLVAMLKGPSVYHPRRNPERALKRRNLVLQELYQQQLISEADYEQAVAKPLGLSREHNIGTSRYPAFLDLVLRDLKKDYQESDLRSEGLKIFTTLDPYIQNLAEQQLKQQLTRFEQRRGLEAKSLQGAVIISAAQTAEIEALVGGRDTRYAGFNRAINAKRQVGSLMKPAIYLTALEQSNRYSLATLLDDSPLSWQEPGIAPWQPNNYDNAFHDQVPLWQAFAKSYNVAAARLGLELGVDRVIDTAQRLGIESDIPPYASSLLGTAPFSALEVLQMYQTLAAGGFRIPLRSIREVLTVEGEPLKRYPLEVKQVVNSEAAYLINFGLAKVVDEGTGQGLKNKLSVPVAGKTGTTDDYRDSWFAGFSGDKVGVVWVGSDTPTDTGLTGASGALVLWGEIFAKVARKPVRLQQPEGVVMLDTHKQNGQRYKRKCSDGIALPFVAGTEPKESLRCPKGREGEGRVRRWMQRIFGAG